MTTDRIPTGLSFVVVNSDTDTSWTFDDIEAASRLYWALVSDRDNKRARLDIVQRTTYMSVARA